MGSGSSPGGAHPPWSEPKDIGWHHKSLVGWWSHPKRSMAPHVKIAKEKKKKKKEGGGKEEEDSYYPNRIGGVLLLPRVGAPLEVLALKASPSPSLLYIVVV